MPALREHVDWSAGGILHSRYMVKEDEITHIERPESAWYTTEGDAAGRNGNVYVATAPGLGPSAPVDSWMAGVFHLVGLIDPRLDRTGFGDYGEAVGLWQYGATMDVLRGRVSRPETAWPVYYPGEGGEAILLRYDGNESPDPLSPCPGYGLPTGSPIVLQLGPGDVDPTLDFSVLLRDGVLVEHCAYGSDDYVNVHSGEQSLGRAILDTRDALVLIPRDPLEPGATYAVTIVASATQHSWSFSVPE